MHVYPYACTQAHACQNTRIHEECCIVQPIFMSAIVGRTLAASIIVNCLVFVFPSVLMCMHFG